MMGDKIVTCVYCGHEYPEGTPASGTEVLTEHIKICEKHPMRAAEIIINKMREALMKIAGAESIDELKQMKTVLDAVVVLQGPESDAIPALNAINVLIETWPAGQEAKP